MLTIMGKRHDELRPGGGTHVRKLIEITRRDGTVEEFFTDEPVDDGNQVDEIIESTHGNAEGWNTIDEGLPED